MTGGSNLPENVPVLGLLMGYQDGLDISILDAEEIEYSFESASSSSSPSTFGGGNDDERRQHKASIQTKIHLHREVFPSHEVVGWYRVGDDVTPEDLHIHTTFMKEYNESPLFVLMHPNPDASMGEKSNKEFPISVYETLATDLNVERAHVQQPLTVFVGLAFELNTGQPERIAVEKAFSEQSSVGGFCCYVFKLVQLSFSG